MRQRMIISGFGGQGVMLIGQVLAQSAFQCGLETTVMPTYGVEQRGGTANTTVIISDKTIGSPVAQRPDILVAMNQASINRFGPRVKQDGYLIANGESLDSSPVQEGVGVISVDADKIAEEIGSAKVSNVVILGVVSGFTGAIPLDAVQDAVEKKLSKKQEYAAMNREALEKGYAIGAATRKEMNL